MDRFRLDDNEILRLTANGIWKRPVIQHRINQRNDSPISSWLPYPDAYRLIDVTSGTK